MTNKFSSKEIHFLKNDSDDFDITPPEKYFSDLLLGKTIQIKTFEDRILKDETPKKKFLCAVIQISSKVNSNKVLKSIQEKSNTIFEETFNSIFNNKKGDNKRGIWESLGNTSFIIAFWDYENDEKASQLIISLKEKISIALKTNILIGIAKFPYHDFSKSQVLENALKAIDHAAFFGPDTLIHFDATSINIYGDRLYQLNKCELALKEYQKGLEIKPDSINLVNSLGVCYGIMGELEKAKFEFKKAIKISPNELMVIYNIGLLHQIEEDIDKAIVYLRKAHGIDSTVFEVELLLGSLLIKKDRLELAMPHLETAGRINGESGLAFRMKGEIYLRNNLHEKAGLEFNKAIKINPADAISLSGYARSLELQNKNLNIARSLAENSIKLEPGNKLFQKRLGIIQGKIEASDILEENVKTA
ncbi:MAG: tetratricopeptide repeat protein [Desulfobacula sp.]|nr:tetratricopeptide repeat protein [Desulfobacula sp.]